MPSLVSEWFSKSPIGLSEYNPTNSITRRNTTVAPNANSRPTWWETIKFNFKPHREFHGEPTTIQSIRAVIFASWLNVLLVFIPVSWALNFAISNDSANGPVVKFVTSFFAIIPLAKLLGFATEELSLRVGETIGGLLNATLGNAVELIVSIIALLKCELKIVQSSLVGSILSNLLLVLGMCFFAGGVRYSEQGFAAAASQLNSSLLVVSVIAVLLPAAFHSTLSSIAADEGINLDEVDGDQGKDILRLSRGSAVILLVTYGAYLIFQLWSHAHLYAENSPDNFKSREYKQEDAAPTGQSTAVKLNGPGRRNKEGTENGSASTAADPSDLERQQTMAPGPTEDREEEGEQPQLTVMMAFITLGVVTALVAYTAEVLVDSIDGLTERNNISKEWVGLILLPIVGNAAEHVTAVTVSVKDKLTLSLGVAAGSSIQIALFVIPFMVVLAWIVGKPLTLLFDPFESITLFLAVLTVNYVTADGRTNWLEGLILINLYFMIGVIFWYYPGSDLSSHAMGSLSALSCPIKT